MYLTICVSSVDILIEFISSLSSLMMLTRKKGGSYMLITLLIFIGFLSRRIFKYLT